MPKYTTEAIRSVALVGHGAAGKTTLTEALLVKAGAIGAPGSVESGNTVCDFDPLEKTYGNSLNSSLVNFAWRGVHVHLIDTPGYPDFAGQAISALAGVDTAVVVVNATSGIELSTVRMMNAAAARQLCRMIVVNKIDADNVDLPGVLASIQESFGRECLPINLPAKGGTQVVDCFFNPDGESDFSSVSQAHQALVDQVVEVDEKLMEVYLEKGEVEPGQLHAPFEKALREGHLIPVCFCSAKNNVGLEELLDIFAKLAPSPAEGNAPPFLRGEGSDAEEFHAEPDPEKHALAHVFKVVVDPYVGKLGVFRVHQGTVTKDSQLFVGDGKRPFKVGHLFVLQGKDHVETDALVPGDIGAVAKVDEIVFDAVLHDSHDEDHIHLRPLEFPMPMQGLAVEPKKKGDEQRLFDVLHKLELEDPCFKIERHPSTHETVVRGLGDLHLRWKLEKMAQQYKLEVATKPPKIPYKETITKKAEGHCRHKKQTGGAGQFGEVFLRVEPMPRGGGFEFKDESKGGVIPNVFIPAVEKGVRQALDSGIIAGYPVEDLRVVVYDGKHHPVDSKEVAFVSAGRKAVVDAVIKAGPIILEPIVNVEILTPEDYIGDLTSDLSSKRGQITGTQGRGRNTVAITGQVPLSELTDYQSRLRSVTGGHGSYSTEYSHYAPVPAMTQQQITSQHKAAQEED
ncbi:MAG: elongation factor G [Betaproteobacteria bacterium RIFCSPLOWO2_12_FULL_63_13]|nr:MAG: elongation factor G [Betaproteobacteria bacterium RIFCSPLOWO2_02_FULL_63_19]OGA46391.1 MAG: elongation factor G [Betaproteobacteria bacterium RIFCSPLOWO2_12_FULL_63_13]